MGRSFVLKDKMGTAVGYLTQGLGAIRCRCMGAKEGMRAIILNNEDQLMEYKMNPVCTEQEWKDEDKIIEGAAIVFGEEIVADTGETLRRRIENRLRMNACDQDFSEGAELYKRHEKKNAEREWTRKEAGSFPQRRWPPPPCMKGAVYRIGMWNIEE